MVVGRVRRAVSVANPREVGLITVAHGVNEFYSVALPPILPLLVADLGVSYAQAGGLLTVFYLAYSVFQLPAGALSDRLGKRRVLSGGMVVLAGGVLLAGFAPDYPTLVAAQALAGVGGSTYHPTGMSMISDVESRSTEGRAMGVHGFGGVAGTALAPALIGGLATLFDWRLALAAGAAVGVAYALVFRLAFPADDRPAERAAPGGEAAADGPASGGETLRGAIGSIASVPLTWWVVGLFVANFLLSLEIGAARTFTTAYLFERLSGSTTVANAGFFLMLVGGGASSLLAGDLADRFDRPALGAATFLVSALLLVATGFVPATPPLLGAWFLVLGAAMWSTLPVMNALTSAYSQRGFSGSLFGLTMTASAMGSAAGPLAFGVLASRHGVAVAFPAIAAVSVVGAVAFLSLGRG